MYKVVNQTRKTWWVKEQVSRRWRNWCQNEVYEETTGADSRDKVRSTFTSRPVRLRVRTSTVILGGPSRMLIVHKWRGRVLLAVAVKSFHRTGARINRLKRVFSRQYLYHRCHTRDFLARFCRSTLSRDKVAVCNCACRTLQLCRINKK